MLVWFYTTFRLRTQVLTFLELRRNMEPPDVRYVQEFLLLNKNSLRSFHFVYSISGAKIASGTLRLRGKGDDVNNDSKHHDIPYLTNIKFRWDGLPCIDFRERVLHILENGLGTTLAGGGTLLQTVLETDPGGRLGNPARAVATIDEVKHSMARNVKAFSCICNYMLPNCWMYKYFMRNFVGEGIAVYNIIAAYGPIPIPPRLQTAREDAWTRMSMETLRLDFSIKGFLTWAEIVTEQARILGKNGTQMKDKFLSGIPKRFEAIKLAMQSEMRFVYPPTYGNLPGHASSLIAATAHPFRGQQYIMALARAFINQWMDKTADEGITPRGYTARSAEEMTMLTTSNPEEIVEILTTDITSKTKCIVCNGDGHAATQHTPNGEVITCPTRLLSTGKNSSSYSQYQKYKQKASHQAKQIEDLSSELESVNKLHDSPTRDHRRRPIRKLPSQHSSAQSADDSEDVSIHDDTDKSGIDDDEQCSDDSAHSMIHDFAEVLNSQKRNPRKPYVRK